MRSYLTEKVSIGISRVLYDKIKHRVSFSQGEFRNVEEYVEFVLSNVVEEDRGSKQIYTPQEEEEIKKRLKSLGYF